jgi:V8-like Glu-specific endopeptidase
MPTSHIPRRGGQWTRRGNVIVLDAGPSGYGQGELEAEAALVQHPRLGYGRRLPAGAPDEEFEFETGGVPIVKHPRLGIGRRLPAGATDEELDELSWPGAGGAGELDREIVGTDDRVRVNPTTAVPFRWICSLLLRFPDPASAGGSLSFRGTGTLIGNRHILTCAHNIRDTLPGGGSTLYTATSVVARPARNLTTNPYGTAKSSRLRWAPGWNGSTVGQDWALITLGTSIGAKKFASLGNQPLGFWSSPKYGAGTRINPRDSIAVGAPLNVAGYPGDKCGASPAKGSATDVQLAACSSAKFASTMWKSFGKATGSSPSGGAGLLLYSMDTKAGHSGSPVWLRWQDYRNLVAVHTGGWSADANRGVRLTDAILTQVRAWMKADGETPTF